MSKTIAGLALALVASLWGNAAFAAQRVEVRKLQPQQFDQLVALIEQEMDAGGRYEYVSDAERAAVRRALDDMARLLEGVESIAALREEQRVALLNAQERVNALLTKRDGERLICSHRRRIGTHMRETTCETYAEQMARVKGTRTAYRRFYEAPCASGSATEIGASPDGFRGVTLANSNGCGPLVDGR
jgi:Arc/MetJ-type ribon-helix-helix transcriptional regulator